MALVHPRMADIEAAVAAATGFPMKEVAITARRMREGDQLTRETRSPRSWRSTPLDAARIAAALMTGVGPIHAPAAVKAMEAVKLEPKDALDVRNRLDIPQPLRSGIVRRPNIVGAIEAMITHVASPHDLRHGGLFEFSSVTYDFRENTGEAWLRWVTLENVIGPKEAHLFYFGPSRRDVGLSARYTLKFPAICQIAQLFRE